MEFIYFLGGLCAVSVIGIICGLVIIHRAKHSEEFPSKA